MTVRIFAVLGLLVLAAVQLSACNRAGEKTEAAAVQLTTSTISVEGMHCDNCVQSIQAAVAALDGVESVSADFARGEAVVSYDAARIDEERIGREIASLGFTVPGISPPAGEQSKPGNGAES